jgi:hypothetical protein
MALINLAFTGAGSRMTLCRNIHIAKYYYSLNLGPENETGHCPVLLLASEISRDSECNNSLNKVSLILFNLLFYYLFSWA